MKQVSFFTETQLPDRNLEAHGHRGFVPQRPHHEWTGKWARNGNTHVRGTAPTTSCGRVTACSRESVNKHAIVCNA